MLGRGRERVAEPGQLGVGDLPVVPAGHAGVQADDPQPGDVVHAVLGGVRLLTEQLAGVRRTLVVVAHAPHHLGAGGGGDRLDEVAQRPVGLGLAEVREVAGEDQRLRWRVDPHQPVQRRAEVPDGVDGAVLSRVVREQMGVADVGDHVGGWRDLAELDHDASVR